MYIVDVFLDKRSSRYIKSIWSQLSEKGIDSSLINTDGLFPHITLAIYEEIDEEKFIDKMKEFKSKMQIMLSVNISPRKVNRYQQQSQTVDKITENLILNVKITELKHDSEKDFFAADIESIIS